MKNSVDPDQLASADLDLLCFQREYRILIIIICIVCLFHSFLASDDFCHLLITFANSLDPDQNQQSVGPDLDPNPLTL